jgi:hypothetical protein
MRCGLSLLGLSQMGVVLRYCLKVLQGSRYPKAKGIYKAEVSMT